MNVKEIFLSNLYGDSLWTTYGTSTWAIFAVALLFVLFGLIIKWYIEITKSIKKNPDTPNKWDWKYFIQNNLFKKSFALLANFIIAIVALRFITEILSMPLSMASALVIGLCFDEVIRIVSQWQGGLKKN